MVNSELRASRLGLPKLEVTERCGSLIQGCPWGLMTEHLASLGENVKSVEDPKGTTPPKVREGHVFFPRFQNWMMARNAGKTL